MKPTNSQMSVDASIASSPGQILVFAVRDVKVRLWITVLLGQTEVDDIDLVASLADAHEKVVGLDVAVDERLCVYVFDAGDELVDEQENGLEREFAVAEIEEILQAGT